jgi:transcriptional regulator with XRE-family HTH domain
MSTPTDTRAERLGQRIRDHREAKGYTIESFAYALGFSWITISRYERGKSTPDLERLHKIADLLGISIGALVTEDEAT